MIEASHRARYVLALDYLGDGQVALDAGCGSGWGVDMLARHGARVFGIDVSAEAISFATSHYPAPNVTFIQADCMSLPLPDGSVDVLTNFEVIEHLEDPPRFLDEAVRVLRPSGTLLLSTPVAENAIEAANPFHVQEFSPPELDALLRSRFSEVTLQGQRIRAGQLVRRLRRERLGIRKLLPKRLQTAVLRAMRETASDDIDGHDIAAFEFVTNVTDCEIMVAIARGPRSA
jgi:ubiquinone/menaquinone biosynthesis C-methylase UbiE